MKNYDYSKNDIINALRKVGIEKDDNVFIHSNIGFFGKLQGDNSKESYWKIFKQAIFEVIGNEGTLIIPTFTYSFCWNKIFDKKSTISTTGLLSELVRNDPASYRSNDANFSVAAIGKNAKIFTNNIPSHSFGANSFWERFLKVNGKVCCFNVGMNYNTFIHYVEKVLNVPYRYDKEFFGKSLIDGKLEEKKFVHFVRDLDDPNTYPDLTEFVNIAHQLQAISETDLGRGKISCISAKATYDIISREIRKNPNLLIKGKFL